MKKFTFIFCIFTFSVFCFGIDTPREQLAKLGVPYTEEAFVGCILKNKPEIVHLFLESGMNPNIKVKPINISNLGNSYSFVTAKTNFVLEGRPLLSVALAGKSLEIVRDLLNHGAEVNKDIHWKDSNGEIILGRTAIMSASLSNSTDFVQLLIDKGANVNLKDVRGDTALIFAVGQTDLNILKILLKSGAIINEKNNDGYTALMGALIFKHPDNANFLIRQGADVNISNGKGETALILATNNNYLDVVKNLLEKGANCNSKTKNGHTPLSIAKSKKYQDILSILVKAGATD